MPAQKQSSTTSADNMLKITQDITNLERSDSLRDIKPLSSSNTTDYNLEPSSGLNPDKSSWNLLKKLFKENKKDSYLKRQDALNIENDCINNNNKTSTSRRFSIDQASSPSFSRRQNSSIKRKTSTGGSRRRKFSTVNSQENLLHYAVIEDDMTILSEVLEQKKVDVNHLRPPGVSALHEACVTGSIDAVQLLLTHGADVQLKTTNGISPLQITTIFGHFEVAQYLIENGANVKDIQDGFSHDVKLLSTILIR